MTVKFLQFSCVLQALNSWSRSNMAAKHEYTPSSLKQYYREIKSSPPGDYLKRGDYWRGANIKSRFPNGRLLEQG